MRREYKTGTKYCVWRWKDIYWKQELYLRRLILVQCPMFSIMLHWIKAPDRQEHLHDHPVSMLSVVLRGFYIEEGVEDSCLTLVIDGKRFDACLSNYTKVVRSVNWIPAAKRHRISAVRGDVLTLCFAGRRKREWGFYTEDGWMQWQEYHKQYEGNTS